MWTTLITISGLLPAIAAKTPHNPSSTSNPTQHPTTLVPSLSRAYPKGCSEQPPSYYNYDDFDIPSRVTVRRREDFLLLRRVGAGKFSDVFEAVDLSANSAEQTKKKRRRKKRKRRKKSVQEASVEKVKKPQVGGQTQKHNVTKEQEDGIVVIKCLKPVSERKIKRELLVLCQTKNLPNLARLQGVCWDHHHETHNNQDHNHNQNQIEEQFMPAIIMQHAGRTSQWLCHGFSPATAHPSTTKPQAQQAAVPPAPLSLFEIKYFLYELLKALDGLHCAGIMHRDVKPRNILINRVGRVSGEKQQQQQQQQQPRASLTSSLSKRGWGLPAPIQPSEQQPSLMLIDLGLADFYHPHQRYNVRVASRHYKAPELLVGYDMYDYAVDVWGVGCILAGLLFGKEPFFRGRDNVDQLAKIAAVLGTDDLLAYCAKFRISLTPTLQRAISALHRDNEDGHDDASSTHSPWTACVPIAPGVPLKKPSEDALDLLRGLLMYDHSLRWTVKEAMEHSFFDDVRG